MGSPSEHCPSSPGVGDAQRVLPENPPVVPSFSRAPSPLSSRSPILRYTDGRSIMKSLSITHLKELESESIYVIREVAAQFERPVLLFSGGKDSIVLSHLARKAFYPAKIPFPLMHIDTGHNFDETLVYRDQWLGNLGAKLIVKYVQDTID